jgi:hypothetical protein
MFFAFKWLHHHITGTYKRTDVMVYNIKGFEMRLKIIARDVGNDKLKYCRYPKNMTNVVILDKPDVQNLEMPFLL